MKQYEQSCGTCGSEWTASEAVRCPTCGANGQIISETEVESKDAPTAPADVAKMVVGKKAVGKPVTGAPVNVTKSAS